MTPDKKKWITFSMTESLIKLSKSNKKFVVLDADLSDDLGLKEFSDLHPKRFIQNGIAEQDMVSMAGGLALSGLLPIVNSFASFLTSRANEQIYNNATENTKIIYLSLYAGLLPAGAGKSHQSLRDISLLSSIPNFKIYHPLNFREVHQILKHCILNEKTNCAIRLSIGPPPKDVLLNSKNIKFKSGKGFTLSEGKKILIFVYGQYMVNETLKAKEKLRKKNIIPKIINMSSLNHFDKNWLKRVIKNYKYIFSIDDHNEVGGLGDNLFDEIIKLDLLNDNKFFKIGVRGFPKCGTVEEVLKFHNLDSDSIVKKIIKEIR